MIEDAFETRKIFLVRGALVDVRPAITRPGSKWGSWFCCSFLNAGDVRRHHEHIADTALQKKRGDASASWQRVPSSRALALVVTTKDLVVSSPSRCCCRPSASRKLAAKKWRRRPT